MRDPEAWEKSMLDTIWDVIYGHSPMAHISKAREQIDPEWRAYMDLMRRMWAAQGVFSGAELRPGQLAEAISRYQEQVQRNIPEHRLLVWNVQEGWEPLCRFLDVDVPQAQFPRLNDSRCSSTDHRRLADRAQRGGPPARGTETLQPVRRFFPPVPQPAGRLKSLSRRACG